ncbi:MAG: hypothetical protein DHS20C09_09120 [marine bacterium B5-7]|nr:MAG: hypothetical protein DHS20C09_09120 [marine bacterium B5-7]
MSLLVSLCLLSSLEVSAEPGAPRWLDSVPPPTTIHVNVQHPQASNNHTGLDENSPLKSLASALKIAIHNRKKGKGTKVLIYPGTYRESLSLMFEKQSEGMVPIMLLAKEPGKSIISGSDIWSDWRQDRGDTFSHEWPYKWGLRPVPGGWPAHLNVSEIVRRREMVFANGTPLKQVLAFAEIQPNTFFINELNRKIYIKLTKNMPVSKTTIEVAVRSSLLRVSRVENFIMKGLKFQHDTTGLQGAAVRITSSRNILIKDCEFSLNNWAGLGLSRVENVTTNRNIMNHNGAVGWIGIWIKNLVSLNDETSYNNWRGEAGGFLRWAVAGLKHLHVHQAIYKGHKAVENLTRGFWLDTDNSQIQVMEACWCKNLTDGAFLELSPGPIMIKQSTICHNKANGVLGNTASQITLQNNQFVNNQKNQILVTGAIQRKAVNWETKKGITVYATNWKIENNDFQTQKSLLFSVPPWKHFLDSFSATDNHWMKGGQERSVELGGKAMTLPQWEVETGVKLVTKMTEKSARTKSLPTCQ